MRINVIGNSGSGKSTLARKMSDAAGIPHIELDELFHGPNWTTRPDETVRADISRAIASDSWIVDGNYTRLARDIVWPRATLIVCLDLPRRVIMRQVIWRSFWRAATKAPLWHGNREQFSRWVDPGHPIRWSWEQFERKRASYDALNGLDIPYVRLRTRREVRAFLDSFASGGFLESL